MTQNVAMLIAVLLTLLAQTPDATASTQPNTVQGDQSNNALSDMQAILGYEDHVSDFVQYPLAVARVSRHVNPYDPNRLEAGREQGSRDVELISYSPPTVLWMYQWVGWMTYPQAFMAHRVLAAILLVACAAVWGYLATARAGAAVIGGAVWILWVPSMAVLATGQVTFWVALAVTLWVGSERWHLHNARRALLGGLAIALLTVKPHLGLLPGMFILAYLWRNGRWSTLAAGAAIILAWVGVTAAWRPQLWTQWLELLRTVPPAYYPATLLGLLKLVMPDFLVVPITTLAWAAGMALAFAWGYSARLRLERYAAAIALGTFVSPHAFGYDFVLLIPGFILAFTRRVERHAVPGAVLAGWATLDILFMVGKVAQWYDVAFTPIGLIAALLCLASERSASRTSHPPATAPVA